MRIFVAGASGAIGRPLIKQLVARAHQVTATTRHPDKVEGLRRLGVEPAIVDGLDAMAVGEAVARAAPDAIIHQMTALAGLADFKHWDRWFAKTNELRRKGTDHLLAAAAAAGVKRFLAQSYTNWNNPRSGSALKSEDDPLEPNPPAAQRDTLDAIRYLEQAVLSAPLTGIILRYGNFYGPGASEALVDIVKQRKFPIIGRGTGVWSWIHVDDAAAATVLAVERGQPGVYNVVDDDPAPVSVWLPYLAELAGARRPWRVPVWLGRLVAGEVAVSTMTEIRGSSNAKARRELGWQPAWPSWRDGFRALIASASTAPAGWHPAASV